MNELLNHLDELESIGNEEVVLIGIPQIMSIKQARQMIKQYDKGQVNNVKIDEDDNLDFMFYGNKARIELF